MVANYLLYTSLLLYTFLVIVFILFGAVLSGLLNRITQYFLNIRDRRILKDFIPQPLKKSNMCKTTHSWISANSYGQNGLEQMQLCRVCGFIPKLNKMATVEAIDRIEENNKIRVIEEKIYKEFLNQEDNDIKEFFKEEIKRGVSFDKLVQLHGAGSTFASRYETYKTMKATEIEQQLKRNDV